jgi:cytochrome P450
MSAVLPGPRGMANLRWTARLARDMYRTLPEMHRAFGDVFEVGVGPARLVYLVGPRANRDLFALGSPDVSWREAFASLVPVDGETAIVVSDGADHARRRGVVQPAFARRRLDDSIASMVVEARGTLAAWTSGSTHDAYDELRTCIRRIVIRALFGDRLGARADVVGERLAAALEYVNRPPWRRFDRDWPGTPYRRAMTARTAVDAIVYEELAARRSDPDAAGGDDLLSILASSDALSDVEVRDQVISLIAAGYDTTSAAAGWMVQLLATETEARNVLLAEIERVVPDDPLTAERLAAMPWLNGVVSETLRLRPPGYVVPRKIDRSVQVAGHMIPGGRLALYNPMLTHRLEDFWPEPHAFRPGRWVDGHTHHQEVEAGSWVPFGGGARRCLGFAFAITELKVLAVELMRVTGGRIHAVEPDPEPHGLAAMTPRGGVPIRVA